MDEGLIDKYIVAVKPQYLINLQNVEKNSEFDQSAVSVPPVDQDLIDNLDGHQNKKFKANKLKKRGQNKNRPNPYQVDYEKELCYTLVDACNEEDLNRKCTAVKCTCIHDIQEYLKTKPSDIGNRCYNYELQGFCSRGLACRFGSSHITEAGFNKINEHKVSNDDLKNISNKQNSLFEVFRSLRKRTYDFSKSADILKIYDSQKADFKKSGVITDEDFIKIRGSERKRFSFTDKMYLSPLTTLGNLPFRRICKEYGAEITCGEMAMCDNILKGSLREWALIKRHESEDIFGVQVCASNPHIFNRSVQLLQENCDFDFIDLNLGCPLDAVYQSGCGSGLLQRTHNLESILYCATRLIDKPFTVKTRTGIQKDNNIIHNFMPKFKELGVSMITIHGRTRVQRYTKSADWEYVNRCAKIVHPIPVYGSGDIFNFENYNEMKNIYTNLSGIMIGRGALIKPWIFREIKEQKFIDISSSERFDVLQKFVNYGLEHWGSDNKGVENTRKFLLEWLSFLHRYVPVGILERPQKINERPPHFIGRNDLETVMASPKASDWIKISEMMLGPVPDGYNFVPKHKANSYAAGD